jgi:hypothetical protein
MATSAFKVMDVKVPGPSTMRPMKRIPATTREAGALSLVIEIAPIY